MPAKQPTRFDPLRFYSEAAAMAGLLTTLSCLALTHWAEHRATGGPENHAIHQAEAVDYMRGRGVDVEAVEVWCSSCAASVSARNRTQAP